MSCEEPPPATKPPTIASAAPPAAPEASSEAPPAPAPAPWTAEDDRVLVDAVEAGASLEALAELKLMQAPRTLEQLRERWQALLFDEGVARSAAARLAEASTAPAAGPSRYLAGGAGFPVYRVLPRPDAPKTDQAGIAEALASEMLSYSDAENAIVQVRRSTAPVASRPSSPPHVHHEDRRRLARRRSRRCGRAQAEQGGTVCTSSKLLHGIKVRLRSGGEGAIRGESTPSPPLPTRMARGRRFRHVPCPAAARQAPHAPSRLCIGRRRKP
jgi:hypothetical protein